MKTSEKTNKRKYFQTIANVTFSFDLKLSVDGDEDELDVEYQAEEILNYLIANGEVVVADSDTAVVLGRITAADIDVRSEITKGSFDAARGKSKLYLGSNFKLN